MGKLRVGIAAAWIISAGTVIASLVGLFAVWQNRERSTYTNQAMNNSPGARQIAGDQNNYNTPIDVARYAEPAFWRTKNCGDRIRYENLQMKAEGEIDPVLKQEFLKYIERIELDYRSSVIGPILVDTIAVCKEGTLCDPEPIKGFSATNVVDHIDVKKYPECLSRARALYLLSNIETASGKDSVDMIKLVGTLVFIMEEDSSLLVSKLALDRYSQFTGFSPSDIFDFRGAINNFHKRNQQSEPILLPAFNFKN